MTISMPFQSVIFLEILFFMFLRHGVLGYSSTIGGLGGPPPGKFSYINPYFLQSEALCDRFHDIKTYFPNQILLVNF